jgi:hypothetical protein
MLKIMGSDLANQIVQWDVLAGLPGEGPLPKHFHLGHPTPWTEGFVVRFRNQDGVEWIGNFQRGINGLNKILAWNEAGCVVVFANGACYRISVSGPDRYSTHGSNVMYALFNDDRTLLLLAHEDGDLIAISGDGEQRWARNSLGAFGVVLRDCHRGIVTAEIETDYDDSWRTVQISSEDGIDAN